MRILVANFHPAFYPPSSGGEQRIYFLNKYLAERHEVTLLTATFSDGVEELVRHSTSFREYRVPKPAVSEALHRELHSAGIGDECSGYVVGLSGAVQSALKRRFVELAGYADLIVHECPFTFPLDETVYSDGKPRVYASYNVEHRLAAQMLRGEVGAAATRFIRFLEGSLVDRADLVFATSDEEREAFVADFGCPRSKLRVLPNGFEPDGGSQSSAPQPVQGGPTSGLPRALFLGSSHPPNVEAGSYICKNLASALPDWEFHILGSVCSRLADVAPPNVKLLGFVDEDRMHSELAGCTAALNPLFSGAGTNLKMLQYMAAGVPILTTPTGARGLDLADGLEALVLEATDFPAELRDLAAAPGRARALGLAAREEAYARYSWAQIAAGYARDLDLLKGAARQRRRILVVNDFPVSACLGGGEVRIFQLLRELGEDFDVDFLCLSSVQDETETPIAAHVRQREFPKTTEHREAERVADEGHAISVRDILASEWVTGNEPFMAAFRMAASHSDIVVFEHPYLAPLSESLTPTAVVVYSSLNVETDLKGTILATRFDGMSWAARVIRLEEAMIARAQLIVAVSAEDAAVFRARNPRARVIVIENGVCPVIEVGERQGAGSELGDTASAVFLGSAHPPNTEAAGYIIERLAPRMPQVTFHLVGSVGFAIAHLAIPSNVIVHGVVDEARKRALLAMASVAINPMFSGGGSSLKVPDFLASGLPLVSTRVGVRGFALREGVDYIGADDTDFPCQLERLVADPGFRRRLGASGRRAVRRLTWSSRGARYRRALRSLIRKAPDTQELRVLVVTYRFVQPAPGGAESYLNNLLANLGGRQDTVVDVATCDVGAISDRWTFSAEYGIPDTRPEKAAGVRNVFRFPIEPKPPDTLERCRELFSGWRRESCAQLAEHLADIEASILMGGWNHAESNDSATWRWSGLRSQIGVAGDWTAIRVSGSSTAVCNVALDLAGIQVASTTALGEFVLEGPLPAGRCRVDVIVDRPFLAHEDPRELGVCVREVGVRGQDGWVALDIKANVEDALRRLDPEAWIDSLVELAEARNPAVDELFPQVRGPHSSALKSWLETHVTDYDVMLVQGVPFAPIVWAPPIARARTVPVVLLPHFHVEDRYYHWQAFYRAFRDAECVLAAPPAVKRQFMDKIDAPSELIPGGGIDIEEYAPQHMQRCQEQFRSVHRSHQPYVLVLGRKTGAKRYELVLEAARLGRSKAVVFDVVMVGPDDDGRVVEQAGVYCYGSRPREFVLGALAGCTCLVNMSDSESFGIVLLEAWAAGKPVIAQRRCLAFADLVRHGENGFLAESPAEILDRVWGYITDHELVARHSSSGRALSQSYSWNALAKRVREVLVRSAWAEWLEPDGRCHV